MIHRTHCTLLFIHRLLCALHMLHHAKVAVLTNRSGMFDDDIVVVCYICYTYIFRYEI